MKANDDDLFLKEMHGVKQINCDKTHSVQKPRRPSIAQLAQRDAASAEAGEKNYLADDHITMVGPHDFISGKSPGLQEGVYRKLRLGKYPIEARLDLHRKSVKEAREDVFNFINDCMRYDLRNIIITHGKGERSRTPAKIKSYVNHWLREIPEVLAYHSAQRHHGGVGAVYVLLRKSEQKKQQNRERFRK